MATNPAYLDIVGARPASQGGRGHPHHGTPLSMYRGGEPPRHTGYRPHGAPSAPAATVTPSQTGPVGPHHLAHRDRA